jgi:hypothetical protein
MKTSEIKLFMTKSNKRVAKKISRKTPAKSHSHTQFPRQKSIIYIWLPVCVCVCVFVCIVRNGRESITDDALRYNYFSFSIIDLYVGWCTSNINFLFDMKEKQNFAYEEEEIKKLSCINWSRVTNWKKAWQHSQCA